MYHVVRIFVRHQENNFVVLIDPTKTILDLKKEIFRVSNDIYEDERVATDVNSLRLYFMNDYELYNAYYIGDILHDGAIVLTSILPQDNPYKRSSSMHFGTALSPFFNNTSLPFRPMIPSSQYTPNSSSCVAPFVSLPYSHSAAIYGPNVDLTDESSLQMSKRKLEPSSITNKHKKHCSSDTYTSDEVVKEQKKTSKRKKISKKPEESKKCKNDASVTFSEKTISLSPDIDWLDTNDEDTHQSNKSKKKGKKKKQSSVAIPSSSKESIHHKTGGTSNNEDGKSKVNDATSAIATLIDTSIDWNCTDDESDEKNKSAVISTSNPITNTVSSSINNEDAEIKYNSEADDMDSAAFSIKKTLVSEPVDDTDSPVSSSDEEIIKKVEKLAAAEQKTASTAQYEIKSTETLQLYNKRPFEKYDKDDDETVSDTAETKGESLSQTSLFPDQTTNEEKQPDTEYCSEDVSVVGRTTRTANKITKKQDEIPKTSKKLKSVDLTKKKSSLSDVRRSPIKQLRNRVTKSSIVNTPQKSVSSSSEDSSSDSEVKKETKPPLQALAFDADNNLKRMQKTRTTLSKIQKHGSNSTMTSIKKSLSKGML